LLYIFLSVVVAADSERSKSHDVSLFELCVQCCWCAVVFRRIGLIQRCCR